MTAEATSTESRIPVIDAWTQPAVAQITERMPELTRLLQQSGTAELLARGVPAHEMVGMMDEAGIERVVLSAWSRPSGWVFSNDQIAEFTTAFPERFIGAAAVNLHRPMEALAQLRGAVRDQGFRALRLIPWLWNLPPNDRLYYPLYAACVELNVPFLTQVGHTGPLMPSETGRPIPYIDQVALDFPELTIVGGHIGYPWTDEMIALAWKHANVYIDTSAYLPRYYPPQLIHFMATYGRTKVLFGSNFPMLELGKCVAQARQLGLGTEVQEAFLHQNARRVFRL